MADNAGAVDLGGLATEEQERLAQMAEETGTDPEPEDSRRKALTGFAVILGMDGNVVSVNLPSDQFDLVLEPTNDLVYALAAAVQKDVAAMDGAEAAIAQQMYHARAMAQQMQTQQMAQGLDLPGMRRG